jgi:hypothetical protein
VINDLDVANRLLYRGTVSNITLDKPDTLPARA